MRISVIYGWAEGNWHGKLLRKQAKQLGYEFTDNAEDADVIIAHSGGCYMLPKTTKAKIIIMTGLPHWPNKHLLKGLAEKLSNERKTWFWFRKTLANIFYLLIRPKKHINMRRAFFKKHIPAFEDSVILLIRNSDDTFMHPTKAKNLADSKQWQYKELDGHHDDLWENPEKYLYFIASIPVDKQP